jgi:hypothetical protein
VLFRTLEHEELDLNGFLELLGQLIRQGCRLNEEAYIEAVKKAREIIRR